MRKLILITTLAFASLYSNAQGNPEISMSFNHVALSVKNVDISAEFYSQVLGLKEIVNRTKKEGRRWLSLGEDKELHLISGEEGEVTINKAVHFAMTTSTFDTFIANLQSRYLVYSSWEGEYGKITIRADGVRQVYIQDPDGYWIEINSVAQM